MCRHCNENATATAGGSLSPAPASVSSAAIVAAVAAVLPPLIIGEQLPLPFVADELYPLPAIAAPRDSDSDEEEEEEEQFECSACGDKFDDEDELSPHCGDSSRLLCGDCSSSCESCGNVFDSDGDELHSCDEADSGRRHRGDSIRCEECSWECGDCSNWFYGSNCGTNTSGDKVCSRCAENYYTCEDCNETIYSDDTRSDENFAEGTFCESCYAERERDYNRENGDSDEEEEEESSSRVAELVNEYNYKPEPSFKFGKGEEDSSPAIPAQFFGIELETETRDSDCDLDEAIRSSGLHGDSAFYCKRDGSLADGKSFEIVSHPGTLTFWREHGFAFAEKLSAAGYLADNRSSCGFHIHATRLLSPAKIAKLLIFAKHERGYFAAVSRRVAADDYYYKAEAGSTPAILYRAQNGNGHAERYTAINLENRRTIEFRIFQGSLSPAVILHNIAFVAAILDFIRSAPLSHMRRDDFRDYLLTSGRKLIGRELSSALIAQLDAYNAGAGAATAAA